MRIGLALGRPLWGCKAPLGSLGSTLELLPMSQELLATCAEPLQLLVAQGHGARCLARPFALPKSFLLDFPPLLHVLLLCLELLPPTLRLPPLFLFAAELLSCQPFSLKAFLPAPSLHLFLLLSKALPSLLFSTELLLTFLLRLLGDRSLCLGRLLRTPRVQKLLPLRTQGVLLQHPSCVLKQLLMLQMRQELLRLSEEVPRGTAAKASHQQA